MISPSKVHPRFWRPVWSDPELAADAEDLALKIANKNEFAHTLALAGDAAAPAHNLALARNVAAEQIDFNRLLKVQHELSRGLSGDQIFVDLVVAAKWTRLKSPARSMILAIKRYEQRVYSRWKKADRAFEAALRRQQRRVMRLAARLQRRIDRRANKSNPPT
jgi:hypothetical protein